MEGVVETIFSDLVQIKEFITRSEYFNNFSIKLEKLMEFLNFLSVLIISRGKIITCISGTKVHIFKTELLDSSVKTLNSIKYCCMSGSFSDANVLVRKYRDDLILFLYIIDVLNNRRYLEKEQISEIVVDEIDADKLIKLIELMYNIAVNGCTKNDDDKIVDAWFDCEIHNLSAKQRGKLSFGNYMKYLKSTKAIDEVIKNYSLELNWGKIQRKLNDYTHNNGRTYTQHNLMTICLTDIGICFNQIISSLNFITAFFMVLLILIDPILIGSTDYIDCLDLGLTPAEDSQYLIAPFVQEFIDEYINKINPDLKTFLKHHTKYGMLIN